MKNFILFSIAQEEHKVNKERRRRAIVQTFDKNQGDIFDHPWLMTIKKSLVILPFFTITRDLVPDNENVNAIETTASFSRHQ